MLPERYPEIDIDIDIDINKDKDININKDKDKEKEIYKEKETERERKEKKEKAAAAAVAVGNNNIIYIQEQEIKKCYEANIGVLVPAVEEEILNYKDLDYQIIIEAIKLSAKRNKPSWKYIKGILDSWKRKGYKTLSDIQEEQKQGKERPLRKKVVDNSIIDNWTAEKLKEEAERNGAKGI